MTDKRFYCEICEGSHTGPECPSCALHESAYQCQKEMQEADRRRVVEQDSQIS